MSKVIVIGAGAAGMMAAVTAADAGHSVVVLEKNDRPGKKIYITGKGRCNVTNDCPPENLLASVVSNPKFLYSAFYGFTSQDMMAFLEKEGLSLKVERGNRVFPASDKSSDVIKTLREAMARRGVKVLYETSVKSLMFSEDGKAVCGVETEDGKKLSSDAVVIATGGLSYTSTGSTGDGYRLAASAGHKVTETMPSLVPLNIKEAWCKDLQGLSLKNVRLQVKNGKKVLFEDFGEMLFTHFGISGPLVLSASARCGKFIGKKPLTVVIDLKPALHAEQLDARILKDFEKYANKQFRNSLSDLLPNKMIPVIVALSEIDAYKQVNEVTKQERARLVSLLKGLTMEIAGLRGYNEAVITRGGVSVREVNPSTMASKLKRGLFFAGEVLDLDALTGGFNLQIAWSTGYLAGLGIETIKENEDEF